MHNFGEMTKDTKQKLLAKQYDFIPGILFSSELLIDVHGCFPEGVK